LQTTAYKKLFLHNDDHNTFEFVIESLIDLCAHTWEQAEQCSLFIHYKGSYAVKEGYFDDLSPIKDAFIERGLGATIE
jgi:ATP-dependent Clp protease adaptor protein ClpS